jgi:hypothetical protein
MVRTRKPIHTSPVGKDKQKIKPKLPKGVGKNEKKIKSNSGSKFKPKSRNEAPEVPELDEYFGSFRIGGNFIYALVYGEPSDHRKYLQRALRQAEEAQEAQNESAPAPTKREIRNAGLAPRRKRRTATFKPCGFYNESTMATASTGGEAKGSLKSDYRSFKSEEDFSYRRFEIFCKRRWRLPEHEEGLWVENVIINVHGRMLERSGLSRCGRDHD